MGRARCRTSRGEGGRGTLQSGSTDGHRRRITGNEQPSREREQADVPASTRPPRAPRRAPPSLSHLSGAADRQAGMLELLRPALPPLRPADWVRLYRDLLAVLVPDGRPAGGRRPSSRRGEMSNRWPYHGRPEGVAGPSGTARRSGPVAAWVHSGAWHPSV
jgi:hypothetical protein